LQAWIVERLSHIGLQVREQTLNFVGRDTHRVAVRCEGEVLGGLQHGSPPEVGGRLQFGRMTAGLANSVAFLDQPIPLDAYWPETYTPLIAKAAGAGASACIARPAPGQVDGPLLYNRDAAARPFPAPLVIVGPSDFVKLRAAADHSLSIDFPVVARVRSSSNVVAATRGFQHAARRVVVTTPRTGWFACGAERGPGIAVLLQLAGRAAMQTEVGVCFAVTTGHEIGHRGMRRFLEEQETAPSRVDLWIHLGACIAARRASYAAPFPAQQAILATPALDQAEQDVFAALGFAAFALTEQSRGEGANVLRAGFSPVRAVAGLHPTFHSPLDDGAAVDAEILSQTADALWAMVRGPR
jgi:hypothetical protein